MNGDNNMSTPFGSDGGKRTGLSPAPLVPVLPKPQVPTVIGYLAGLQNLIPRPWVPTQPLPTFSHTNPSTSFHKSLRPVHPAYSSSRSDSFQPMYSGPRSVTQPAPMNGYGGKRTGLTPSPLIPVPPYPQAPTVMGYPTGSQHVSPGPRVSSQPLPTFSNLSHTSPSTSFHNALPPRNSLNYGPRSVTQPAPINGYGNVKSSTQHQNPLCNDGDKRTGVSPSPLIPVPPYPQVPPVTGSQPFSPRPWVSTQPLPNFSYSPHTSPSTSLGNPLRLVHPSRDPLPLKNPLTSGPRSVTQPAPVFSSLPPSPVPSYMPPVAPKPRSVTQPAPVFSSLPPSPVPSYMPPVAPKPRSVCRKSRPPKNPSATAHVENTYSSIEFNQNPSPLPSQVPVTRSSSMSVSGTDTLPPRKSHKRTEDDIIGMNSTTPLIPPESSYPPQSDLLVADSTSDTDDDLEWLYDEIAMKDFHDEYMILDNTDNDANGNETVDGVITIHDADCESKANNKRCKTGQSTSGVKIIADKGKDKDNSPSTDTEKASSSKLGNGDYNAYELQEIARSTKLQKVAAEPKEVRRLLANRASAQRSAQKKLEYIAAIKEKATTLENEKALMSRKITDLEKNNMRMARENREMMIQVESLEKQAQLRAEIKRQKASVVAQRLKEEIAVYEQLTAEFERLMVKLNHGQLGGSNMQPLDQNMVQQVNINQFNQAQSLDPTQQVNINHFNQPQPMEPNMFEQLDTNQFNQQELLEPNMFQQFDINQLNQPQALEPNMFQQFDTNQFNETQLLEPNMFEQLDTNQFNQQELLEPNMFQQFDINQLNQQQLLEPNKFQQFDINQINQPQAMEPNMFQQFDTNQFNQSEQNFEFYGQS